MNEWFCCFPSTTTLTEKEQQTTAEKSERKHEKTALL
jgi:hypothetical protein